MSLAKESSEKIINEMEHYPEIRASMRITPQGKTLLSKLDHNMDKRVLIEIGNGLLKEINSFKTVCALDKPEVITVEGDMGKVIVLQLSHDYGYLILFGNSAMNLGIIRMAVKESTG